MRTITREKTFEYFKVPCHQAFDDLEDLLQDRILIMDGVGHYASTPQARGRRFPRRSIPNHPGQLKGNNDLLSLTRPDIIRDIHRTYFEREGYRRNKQFQ